MRARTDNEAVQKRLAPCRSIEKRSWTRTDYFRARQKKLCEQAPAARTQLLQSKHIYFNSVRSHSQRALESLVWRHGGTVHKNYLRTVVTHVIADNLCSSKMTKEANSLTQPQRRSQGVVVNPDWLLQSIKQQKVLPTWEFQVVRNPRGTTTIDSFFRTAKESMTSKHNASTVNLSKKKKKGLE